MPNVSVSIRADRWPEHKSLEAFADECTDLCIGVMRAARDKVHIDFIKVDAFGVGHPASIEIKYRTETHRTPEVMSDFVKRLDLTVSKAFGLTARIRCFGFGPAEIHAIN